MFTSAGNKTVTLGEVKFSESKFSKDPNAFDINIRVTNKANPAETDWARLEMSGDYGKGNFADRTQAQISADTLRKLGFEGQDLTTIESQLSGKDAVVFVKESKGKEDDGKVFFNVQYFVTGGNEPVEIDKDTLKRKMTALFGGAADAGTGAQAPAPTFPTPPPPPAPTPPPAASPFASGAANPFAPRK